jgi:hypothetical protein
MAVRRSATSKALRHLAPVIGAAPSTPTVWRALEETGDLQLRRINTVVVEFRGHRDSGESLTQVASGQDWAPLAVGVRGPAAGSPVRTRCHAGLSSAPTTSCGFSEGVAQLCAARSRYYLQVGAPESSARELDEGIAAARQDHLYRAELIVLLEVWKFYSTQRAYSRVPANCFENGRSLDYSCSTTR